jgi:Holliday junction resolvase RusA-like endonuclease
MREASTAAGAERHKGWRAAVRAAAVQWLRDHPGFKQLTGPVELHVEFAFVRPASDPFRVRHAVTPDLSKLVRAVEDALTDSGVWRDDALVYRLNAQAHYVDDVPGARVVIIDHSADEANDRQFLKDAKKAAREVVGRR